MKNNYQREYPLYSLCGLNCGLCPMFHISETSHCPGCGGEGRPSCAVIRCSQQHGGIEYCYLCEEFPCKRYEGIGEVDSFITYQNVLKDFERAKQEGIAQYKKELNKKVEILRFLLNHFNDGRRKSFFCLAVNLLELDDLEKVLKQIEENIAPDAAIKEKAAQAADLFQEMARRRDIILKRKKVKKSGK